MKRFLVSTALLLLCSTWNVLASEPKKALVFEYGYGSTQDIQGTGRPICGHRVGPNQESEEASYGLSYLYYVKDDLSLHLRGWVPKGDPGADTASLSVGLDYWFGKAYVPLSVGYWNDLETVAFGAGVGLKLPIGKASIQGDAGVFYLDDEELDDQTAWKAVAGVGFGF